MFCVIIFFFLQVQFYGASITTMSEEKYSAWLEGVTRRNGNEWEDPPVIVRSVHVIVTKTVHRTLPGGGGGGQGWGF